MNLVKCQFDKHGSIILEIFNEVIEHSSALYETELRTLQTLETWFKEKEALNTPILGIEENGHLLGFASYGSFRPQPAMHLTAEHSLYIHKNSRGKKVGQQLLTALLEHLGEKGYQNTIAAIDSENKGCIILHEKFGFTCNGKIKQAAKKFNRWLDLELYQLKLS